MKRIWIIGIISSISICILSPAEAMNKQQAMTEFVMAQGAYKDGDYEKAIRHYESIIERGLESGGIYYNLGNSYYKVGKRGKAILNYERAKRLLPRDSDLQFNDRYVRKSHAQLQDRRMTNVVFVALANHINFYTIDEMVLIITLLFILIGVLFLLSRFWQWSKNIKMITRIIPTILLIVFIFGLVIKLQEEHNLAVVIKSSSAHFEPVEDAIVHFKLPQGKKVKIIKFKDGWVKIQRVDKKLGWVKASVLEKI